MKKGRVSKRDSKNAIKANNTKETAFLNRVLFNTLGYKKKLKIKL